MKTSISIFFAVILALIYNLKNDEASIQDRLGLLFFVVINQAFGPLNSTKTFIEEKQIVHRERLSNSYSRSAYFLGRVLAELPADIILAIFYCVIIYWGSGKNLYHYSDYYYNNNNNYYMYSYIYNIIYL